MSSTESPTAADPIRMLESAFVERLPEFFTKRSGGVSCNDYEEALGQLEILLAASPYLDREPERFGLNSASARPWLQAHLRDGIKEFFRHLDANGLVAGWDIDGTQHSNSHYRAAPAICDALRALDGNHLAELRVEIDRQKSSSAHIFKLLKPYGTHERPGYRGLNLILSDIAGLYEAGVYFEKPEWIATAKLAMERAVARQDPEGFFPDYRGDEDAGPSSAYMEFTLFTIAPLLVAYPEEALAERCVRGVDWMMKSFDLSGRAIDIFDERERFKRSPGAGGVGWASPLFYFSPAGREWLRFHLEQSGKFELWYSAIVLNFKRAMEKKNPAFLRTLERSKTWFTHLPRYACEYKNRKSAVSVTQPWLIAGHGYLTGKLDPKSMWHRELQQHHSLHHKNAGIIFGGGNSLAQPEFSTLRTGQSYLCDRVRIEQCGEPQQTVLCENGSSHIAIHTSIVNANEANVKCEVLEHADKAFWQLTLGFFLTRKQLIYNDVVITDFLEKPVSGTFESGIAVTGTNGDKNFRVEIQFSAPCEYKWPLYPVNVREPGSKPMPLYTAVMPLKFALPEKGKCIEVSVRYSE